MLESRKLWAGKQEIWEVSLRQKEHGFMLTHLILTHCDVLRTVPLLFLVKKTMAQNTHRRCVLQRERCSGSVLPLEGTGARGQQGPWSTVRVQTREPHSGREGGCLPPQHSRPEPWPEERRCLQGGAVRWDWPGEAEWIQTRGVEAPCVDHGVGPCSWQCFFPSTTVWGTEDLERNVQQWLPAQWGEVRRWVRGGSVGMSLPRCRQ